MAERACWWGECGVGAFRKNFMHATQDQREAPHPSLSSKKTWARVPEAEERFCATKCFRVEEHRSARLAGEMYDFTCDPEDAFPSAADSEP
ncbi:hypothetical protein Spb1_31670 [Planctopirus ephydatiae]|jgi:hypothetical protein|uniref:Uncharacterized protein n=1 Tax=Planctopirus ephydatiae TaxID=2528019 RepID=A0A518GRK3_9PLAN|nr:hypothetical protein Spb1_31670 [Planctopirus ephydatiae]